MPTRLDYIVEDTQLYIDISKEISGTTKLADSILYANIEPSGNNLNSNLAVSFAKIWTWAHDIFDFSPSGTDKIMIKASVIPSSIDTTYVFQEGSTVGAFQVKEGTSAWQTIAVHGVPTVDGNGKILQTFLPSYVDDVIEAYYDNGEFYSDPTTHTSATEIAHESGKIYVDITTNTSYRWGGSSYILITNPIDVFTGATAQANGVAGLVPAPLIADKDKFLKGDGTWDTPATTLPIASGATLGGIKVGNGLQIDANGVLSIDTSTTPIGTMGRSRGLLNQGGTALVGNITELEVDE